MRKKLLSICLLLLIAISAGAQTEFTVDNFKYTVTDDVNHYVSVSQNSENAPSGAVAIPSSVTYETVIYAVTAVGDGGFNGTGITSVTIPASVLTIGDYAFQYCNSMTSITIADSETPLSLAGTYGERPFWNNASIIYLGRNLTLTGDYVNFPLLENATSVVLGPKVTTINPYLFSENSKLENLTIGNGVTRIGEYAFNSCGTYWDDETHQGVENLVVEMGSNVTAIDAHAFQNCDKLKSVSLPSTLTTIGNEAFYRTGLTSISIPASVTSIGDFAFQYCDNMTSITIEDSETPLSLAGTYSERPLWNPAATIYLGRDLTLTGDYVNFPLLENATSVVLGPKVTTINPYLFSENSKLENLTIGNGVTRIGEYAFNSCGTYWDEETNQGVEEMVVEMGSNVTAIDAHAFQNCGKLKSVSLPSTLTTIGNEAFYRTGLTSISIPASVTSIGDFAFQYCDNMTSITIEDSETPLSLAGTYSERPLWNPAATIYLGRDLNLTGDVVNHPLLENATSVEFGPQVTAIPNYLFSGVTLSSVKVPWLTPITLNAETFSEGTYTNATLLVPGGTKEAYEDDDDDNGWKAFTTVDHWSTLVTLTASAHGSIVTEEATASNSTEQYRQPKEDAVAYTLTADEGYELTALTDNDAAVSPLPTLGEEQTRANTEGEEFVTLNASFTPITYTLEYELAGGTVASANPTTYTIESSAITLNNPTREGYTFAGWTGTGLDAATTAVTIAAGSTGNRSYTATWTPIIYNIALTLNGGTADNPATYTIESAAITLNNPTREGYTFAGWKLNGEGVALMSVTIVAGSTGNKAYTATWTPVSYTISYDLAGGSVASANPTSYNIESAPITLINPTKDGYDFAGWTGTGLDAATKTVIIATGNTGNRSYTATWTKKTYNVSITGGGVTADNDNPQYGDDVVLTIMDDPDATLTSLTVNGTEVKESIVDNQYTIENVSGNVSVEATWSSTKEFITLAHAQATFSCDRDLDFSEVSGLKAYIASGYDRATGTVLLTRVESVPARTGLLLVGTEGATYKVPYAESTSFFVNLLQPVLDAQVVPATVSTYTNFLYGEKEGVKGFYKSSGEGTVSAKKAYLQLPTAALGGGAGVRVAILFDDADEDEETAIKDMQMANGDEAVYNLNGLRVANKRDMNRLPKGIYIIGGRKVTLK